MKKLTNLAETIDAMRIVPRLVLGGYFWIVIELAYWAMGKTELSTNDMALVTVVTAMFVPLSKFYNETGRNWIDYRNSQKEGNINDK